jgi:hypothetical protein
MTITGWIFISVSWVLILSLAGFCFMKIFMKKDLD